MNSYDFIKHFLYLVFISYLFMVFNVNCGIKMIDIDRGISSEQREIVNNYDNNTNNNNNNSNENNNFKGHGQNCSDGNCDYNLNYTNNNNMKRLSEIKCDEYRNMIMRMRNIPIVHPTNLNPIALPLNCKSPTNLLIANGQIAQYQEFPHMAAIGWEEEQNISYLCGGSLISAEFVLTAAHCAHTHLGKPQIIRLGSNKLYDNSGQLIKISKIITHPKYKKPNMYFDIALLKLVKPVIFDGNIHPACLHSQYESTPPVIWATGWGSRQYDEPDFSEVLLKVKLHVIDTIQCSMTYNVSSIIPHGVVPSMICAGDPYNEWKGDTCLGDSGGPLQIFDQDTCLYHIVGITSFGKLCMMINSPGVYTRVSHYLDWIERIVWP